GFQPPPPQPLFPGAPGERGDSFLPLALWVESVRVYGVGDLAENARQDNLRRGQIAGQGLVEHAPANQISLSPCRRGQGEGKQSRLFQPRRGPSPPLGSDTTPPAPGRLRVGIDNLLQV